MVMVADSALATHTRPSGDKARLRGALPTEISANFKRVIASKTVTLSLSGFTTQRREFRLVLDSQMMLVEAVGRVALGGAKTAW